MKKMTSPSSAVRRLCRQINHEVDSVKLQDLALRLQQLLRQEQNSVRFERSHPISHDDPFDKVLAC
jgi:hypothetical protein